MKTMWELPRYSWATPTIEPIQVVSETEKTAIVIEPDWAGSGVARKRKRLKDGSLFATWAEARDELLGRRKRAVEVAKAELQRARSALGEVESMKEPAP